jgi:segregation and condensation protein B
MDDKKKVEAVLFTTGKLMSVEEIGKSVDIEDLNKVKCVLEELRKEYDERDSALVIQVAENRYKLNIKKEYGYIANKLVATSEMEGPVVKTLALIAFKNPALQSDIIKARGNKAYDHITALKEQGLIDAEKHGRTRLLKLTPQFYDYFDTAAQEVKEKFKEIEEKAKEIEEKKEKQEEAEKEMKEREKEDMIVGE